MKYTKIILAMAGFLIGLAAFTPDANAQTVSGYTAIDYFEDTNTVDAYSETDEDYDVDAAYGAWVALSVTDQNNNIMGWQSASDDGTYGYAAVEIQFSGSPDSTYTARGSHKAYAQQWDYDYSNWPMVTTIWYDYYNFSDFAAAGIQVPVFYAFQGPGPDVTRGSQQIILGTTHDEDSISTPAIKPASLTVLSVEILPTGTTGNYGCGPSQDYGIKVAIKYQVIGDDDQPLQKADMRPQEKLTNSVVNDVNQGDPLPDWGDMGPSRISGTSRVTDANGQFLDAPYGFCYPGTFTHTETQEISILVGKKRYPVRTNSITESSTASGAGSTSNTTDIVKSRP